MNELAANSRAHARRNPCQFHIQTSYDFQDVSRADYRDTMRDLNHGEFRTGLRVVDGVPHRTVTILDRPIPPPKPEPRILRW